MNANADERVWRIRSVRDTGRYNARIRQLVSFERAAECAATSFLSFQDGKSEAS